MKSSFERPVRSGFLILWVCAAGCATIELREEPIRPRVSASRPMPRPESPDARTQFQHVKFQETIQTPPSSGAISSSEDPFARATELSVDDLVNEVLARNPSLAQMTAAWQAASARYPQVRSLEDPMFGYSKAPGAIGSNMVEGGYRLEVSQKIPFLGKRRLRGLSAAAEADAADNEIEDMRLQLIEAAKSAFYDYYLVDRALAVNEENLRLLKSFRANAEARYKGGLVPQQDVLQADVELGRQQERQLELEQKRTIVIARINTLMSLSPDLRLPPAPKKLEPGQPLSDVQTLREVALTNRPDLQALANRLQAEETAIALARREFFPDAEFMAAYDAFWQEKPLRTMIGVKVNLPIQLQRRFGALNEAQAKAAQRSAELARLTNDVNFQVQEAYEQVRTAEKTVALYKRTLLPTAEANVKNAQSSYVTGKIPFLSLIEAQRSYVNLYDRFYEVTADYFRRRATLERVIGTPLSAPE